MRDSGLDSTAPNLRTRYSARPVNQNRRDWLHRRSRRRLERGQCPRRGYARIGAQRDWHDRLRPCPARWRARLQAEAAVQRASALPQARAEQRRIWTQAILLLKLL